MYGITGTPENYDNEKLNLSRFSSLRGKKVVLSSLSGVAPSKRAKLARDSLSAEARGENSKTGEFTLVNKNTKRQYKGRAVKFSKMTKAITDFVIRSWYSGAPVTRQGCYMKAKEMCVNGDLF